MKYDKTYFPAWLLLLFCLVSFAGLSQTKPKTDSIKTDKNAPEIFTSGFIDVMNNGQVNASQDLYSGLLDSPTMQYHKDFQPHSSLNGKIPV